MLFLEIIATITGIQAVALQAKEKIISWPIAIVSVSISAFIFFHSKLYSDLLLHVVYVFLNIYGWISWINRKEKGIVIPTKILSYQGFALSILVSIAGAFLLGYLMNNFTDADMAYVDAFTTSMSMVAMVLLAKKYLQNWILWIIVDLIAVPMYVYKGFIWDFRFGGLSLGDKRVLRHKGTKALRL